MYASLKSVFWKFIGYLTSPPTALFSGELFFKLIGLRKGYKKSILSDFNTILVVRLDEIGDVVLTTPFLRELRRSTPSAWITLIVKPTVYNLAELCPHVNEVIVYDWNTQGRLSQLKSHWRALKLSRKYLWHRRFELAIVPRFDVDYYNATFIAYFSGALLRVGYSERVNSQKKILNKGLDHLLTHVLNYAALKHEVEHNLDVIPFLGGSAEKNNLELWLSSEDEEFAGNILKLKGIDSVTCVVAFGMGASAPKRMWPIAKFVEVARWLIKQYHARIIVVGGYGEESLGKELRNQLNDSIVDVIGKTTLRQTSALLKHCHLYVGNDSGPMHLAAAAGVPIIEISSFSRNASPQDSNSPARFRPWGVPHIILQPKTSLPPCVGGCTASKAHCINAVSVTDVQNAIARMLH